MEGSPRQRRRRRLLQPEDAGVRKSASLLRGWVSGQAALLEPGTLVWVRSPASDSVFERAIVRSDQGLAGVLVKPVDAKQASRKKSTTTGTSSSFSVAKEDVFLANCDDEVGFPDDMTALPHISEATLLWTLEERCKRDMPYTFLGPVLVAVNPLKEISVPNDVQQGMVRIPHPHTLAESVIQRMEFRRAQGRATSQSIVISGESGSGKTVTAKMILRHIVGRCYNPTSGRKSSKVSLDVRLLDTNPILEAFANAETLRNENSSRFGKFFRLHFDEQNQLSGASLETYLLERSRVTSHAQGERSFHVFYEMVAGMSREEKSVLFLDGVIFNYMLPSLLGAERQHLLRNSDEAKFHELRAALGTIGLNSELQRCIFEIVAGVLHLGNIGICTRERDHEADVATVEPNCSSYHHATSLLGFHSDFELSKLFCDRVIVVGKERTIVSLDADAAVKARDAVAKEIYARLFEWICARINESVGDVEDIELKSRSGLKDAFIGVLDIFGFESFERNDLEQLLINFANERLQTSFNKQVLEHEAELYVREGLTLRSRLGLASEPEVWPLENAKEHTLKELLRIVDEESKGVRPSEKNLNRKILQRFKKSSNVIEPHPRERETKFIVAHSAGTVEYTVGMFIEKNDDSLPVGTPEILLKSANPVLEDIARAAIKLEEQGIALMKQTIAKKFTIQMEALIRTLDDTKCTFVRCIKPNPVMKRQQKKIRSKSVTQVLLRSGKAQPWFMRKYVVAQLKSLGITRAALTLKDGLPLRLKFEELLEMFEPAFTDELDHVFALHAKNKLEKIIPALLYASGIPQGAYRVGRTQAFFHNDQIEHLESAMHRVQNWRRAGNEKTENWAKWRSACRSYLVRRRWRVSIVAVLFAEKCRRVLEEHKNRETASKKIQSVFRCGITRLRFERLRVAAIMGQKMYRGWQGRETALERIAFLEDEARRKREELQRRQEDKERRAALLESRKEDLKRRSETMSALKHMSTIFNVNIRASWGSADEEEEEEGDNEDEDDDWEGVESHRLSRKREDSGSRIQKLLDVAEEITAQYERVRKKSMVAGHFDQEAFTKAMQDQASERMRRDDNIAKSYVDRPEEDTESLPHPAPQEENPEQHHRQRVPLQATRNEDFTASHKSRNGRERVVLTSIACKLSVRKRLKWNRRFFEFDVENRTIAYYAQNHGKPRLKKRLGLFQIHPADFDPPPKVMASHDENGRATNSIHSSSSLRNAVSRMNPGKFMVQINGGKLDKDILQETRTLIIAFEHLSEMLRWKKAIESILVPPRNMSSDDSRSSNSLFMFGSRAFEDDDSFIDAESMQASIGSFGAQVKCKNKFCNAINNTLFGPVCFSCGFPLSEETVE